MDIPSLMSGRNSHTYIVSDSTGAETGPLNLEQILALVRSGQVTGATWVKRNDQEHWGTAADFPELKTKDTALSPNEAASGAISHGAKVDPLAAEMEQSEYAKPIRNGGNWFFWVAALSLINTIAVATGNDWGFALGLQLTYFIGLTSDLWGAHGNAIALAGNLLLVGGFIWFGIAGYSRKFAPYFLGVFIYAGDTILSLLSLHVLTIGIHAWALYCMVKGLSAFMKTGQRKWPSTLLSGAALTAVVVVGAIVLAGASGVKQALASKQEDGKQTVDVAAVMEPDLYVHNAEFDGYSPLTNGLSVLVKLPSGKVVAVMDTLSLASTNKDGKELAAADMKTALKQWTMVMDHDHNKKVEIAGPLSTNITSGADSGAGIMALNLKTPPTAKESVAPLQLRTNPPVENEVVYLLTPIWTGDVYEYDRRQGVLGPEQAKGFVGVTLGEWVDDTLLEGAIVLDKEGKLVGLVPRMNLDRKGKLPSVTAMSVEHLKEL
jgi:hypothetical protein